jgi:hypothetical protein
MRSTRLLVPGLVAVLCTALASPASADVTVKSKGSGKGMVGGAVGDMTQYLKGGKMRMDQTTGAGRATTTIIDAVGRRMVILDHEKKQAKIVDMAAMGEALTKVSAGDLSVAINPTTQTRTVVGMSCTVYDVKVTVPMQGAGITMVMSGPQCLSKNAPGMADFIAFYKAASQGGMFFDPAQAKAQPALAKAMADMQRQMSELGIPLATETTVGMDGSGPMAEMMKKMSSTITTEVVSIATDAIPDSTFEVPAGYAVKK